MKNQNRSHRPRRPWLWVLAGLIAALFAAGVLVESLLPLEQFRAPIEEAVTKATGLPASVAELEADFLPYPRLEAHGVVLGDADFQADVKSVRVYAALFPLLQKRVEITEVELASVRLTVPEAIERLRERLSALGPKKGADDGTPQESPGFKAAVAAIEVKDLAIFHPGQAQPLVSGQVRLKDVLSEDIALAARLDAPVLGDDATVRADIRVKPPRDGSALDISGRISAADVNARLLARNENVPPLLVSLDANLDEVSGTAGAVELNGRVAPGSAAAYGAAEGELRAVASLVEGGVDVSGLVYGGKALEAEAEASWRTEGGLTIRVASLRARAAALEMALRRLPQVQVQVAAEPEAELQAEDISVQRPAGEGWMLSAGTLSLTGLAVKPPVGEAIENIGLEASAADNVLRIHALTFSEGEFSGSVDPGARFENIAVDLAGEVRLTPERTAALMPTTMVRDVAGRVALEESHLDLNLAERSADWRVDASLHEGSARIGAPGFVDSLEQIALDLSANPESVRVKGTMQAATHGPMTVDVAYALPKREVSGTVGLDVATLTLPLPPSAAMERVNKVLDAYGPSDIGFTAPLPSPEQTNWAVGVSRKGAPGVAVNLEMVRDAGGGWRLAVVQASADAAPLAAAGPEGLDASGRLNVRHAVAEGKTDLGAKGFNLFFRGHAVAEGVEGGLKLEQGAHAVEGTIVAVRLDANMIQPLADAMQGRRPEIPYRDDGTYGTRMTDGAEKAKTADGAAEPDAQDAVQAPREGEVKEEAASPELQQQNSAGALADDQQGAEKGDRDPLTGNIAIEVGELVYRRGTFSDVAATLALTPESIAVRELRATPYKGALTGNVEISRGSLPVQCAVDLALEGIEARILDDTAFGKPRNFHGTLDGTLNLRFPAGGGVEPMKHMDGRVELVGEKGSFGEIAVLTQLLTVLRATEVVYLRMPNLKDQGLAYDRFEGQVRFQDGVAELSKFEAHNPTLYMSLNGRMDFPKDEADLKAQVALLAGVPGLVEKIGLGGVAGGLRDAASVRAHITGPPASPKVKVTKVGEALKKGVEAVAGTAGAGLKAVESGAGAVKEVTGGLLGGILGGGKAEAEADSEPKPERDAESGADAQNED